MRACACASLVCFSIFTVVHLSVCSSRLTHKSAPPTYEVAHVALPCCPYKCGQRLRKGELASRNLRPSLFGQLSTALHAPTFPSPCHAPPSGGIRAAAFRRYIVVAEREGEKTLKTFGVPKLLKRGATHHFNHSEDWNRQADLTDLTGTDKQILHRALRVKWYVRTTKIDVTVKSILSVTVCK